MARKSNQGNYVKGVWTKQQAPRRMINTTANIVQRATFAALADDENEPVANFIDREFETWSQQEDVSVKDCIDVRNNLVYLGLLTI